jgi:hypothetical protein
MEKIVQPQQNEIQLVVVEPEKKVENIQSIDKVNNQHADRQLLKKVWLISQLPDIASKYLTFFSNSVLQLIGLVITLYGVFSIY